MKVCFFIGDMSRSGGTERVLALIANGLVEKGYEVCILNMFGNRQADGFYSYSSKIRREWLSEPYPDTIKGHMKKVWELYRFLKKVRPDVLVEVDLILSLYTVPANMGCHIPVISWEHFNFYYQFRKHNRIRRVAMVLAALFSKALVVLTKEDQNYYRSKFHLKKKVVQIYNPNSYQDNPLSAVDNSRREKMVLAAGRLTKAKGFDYLLCAWKQLEPCYPQWQLVIAGEGEEGEHIENMIKQFQLSHVTLAGNVEHIEKMYQRASVFSLSSRNEGFGMVLTEAMYYGIPVVSFDCKAGPKDIVIHGQNGFLVQTGDVDKMAKRLAQLMKNQELREQMGAQAKKDCSRFQIDPILEKWDRLLACFDPKKRKEKRI